MSESPQDKRSRVMQMVIDRGETWDLSLNDKAALKHVLWLVEFLALRLAVSRGTTTDSVITNAESFASEDE